MKNNGFIEFKQIKYFNSICMVGIIFPLQNASYKLKEKLYKNFSKSEKNKTFIDEFNNIISKETYFNEGLFWFADFIDVIENNGLEWEEYYGYNTYVIGYSPNKIRDNQTFGEFKKEIKDRLINIGIENSDPEFIFVSFSDDEYKNKISQCK